MQRTYNEPMTKRAEQRRNTEARILAAARQAFAASGYDRATIRAIAAAAGVNPGLVMHYFGSKRELFRRAADMTPAASDAETPEALAEFLLGSLGVKLDGMSLATTATLRSMLTHPETATGMRTMINDQMRRLGDAIDADDAQLRAMLVGATVLGVVVGRHLLQLDELRDAPAEKIIALLRPGFQALAEGHGSPGRPGS